jgi:hypothetical protein
MVDDVRRIVAALVTITQQWLLPVSQRGFRRPGEHDDEPQLKHHRAAELRPNHGQGSNEQHFIPQCPLSMSVRYSITAGPEDTPSSKRAHN